MIQKNQAVIYLRVSTEEQVDNYSLDTQENICVTEATKQDYEVLRIFREEGKSAKSISGRPVLIELIEFCRKNRKNIQALIFYKTDRLSRQMTDYLIIKEKLNNLGIKLISATEPIDDSPMGKFIGNFYAGIAQLDNEIKSERVKNGMRARFQSGLIASGTVPLGYIRHEGYVFRDKETWETMKKAWLLMATGTKSLKEMAVIMNSWGLRIKKSNISYPLRAQTTNRIFRSKFYIGKLVSKRYQEEVQGQHEPMISKEIFDKVQDILNQRVTRITVKPVISNRNHGNPDFPLRRITRCGKCGLGFTGGWSHGRNAKYAYYVCYKAKLCHSPSVKAELLHKSLSELLKDTKISKEGERIVNLLIENEHKKRISMLTIKRVKREQTLKKLLAMRSNLVQKHLSGVYSDELFLEENEMLTKAIENIKKSENESLISKYSLNYAQDRLNGKLTNLYGTYNDSKLELKKSLLVLLFPNGLVWHYPGLNFSILKFLFEV